MVKALTIVSPSGSQQGPQHYDRDLGHGADLMAVAKALGHNEHLKATVKTLVKTQALPRTLAMLRTSRPQ